MRVRHLIPAPFGFWPGPEQELAPPWQPTTSALAEIMRELEREKTCGPTPPRAGIHDAPDGSCETLRQPRDSDSGETPTKSSA